jgi:hypothetical protein
MAVVCNDTRFNNSSATITRGELCNHPAERFAEVAMQLEPMGEFWCKQYGTIKAKLYLAFGGLLSAFNQRLCDLLRENTGCEAVETISEWEFEYGLPSACQVDYPTDLAGRQAQVCAARRGGSIRTLLELQALIRVATQCDYVTLEETPTGICVRGITGSTATPYIHNVVGGHGLVSQGDGSGAGQPLQLVEPSFVAPPYCRMIYHSVVGGWTGGIGVPLTQQTADYQTLICLLQKHLPAHVSWYLCEDI